MIYFLRMVGTEYVKIGFTASTDVRYETIQTASPFELRVEAIVPGSREVDEKATQLKFIAHLVRGEWYRLSTEQVLEYTQHGAMPHPGLRPIRPDLKDSARFALETLYKALIFSVSPDFADPDGVRRMLTASAFVKRMTQKRRMLAALGEKVHQALHPAEHHKLLLAEWEKEDLAWQSREIEYSAYREGLHSVQIEWAEQQRKLGILGPIQCVIAAGGEPIDEAAVQRMAAFIEAANKADVLTSVANRSDSFTNEDEDSE